MAGFFRNLGRSNGRVTTEPNQIPPELQNVLQEIVDNIVHGLGCVGALLATLEPDNTLPVRAYAIGFSGDLLKQLEDRLGISLAGPNAVAHINDPRHQDNLSVRAVTDVDGVSKKYIVTDKLYELFTPIINRPLSDLAQRTTGIKKIVAVPFFIDDEVAGNVFAATTTEFSDRDLNVISAFANQAATAIQRQRQLTENEALERINLALQRDITDETQVLQTIVDAVVHELHYVGAIMTTLEAGNALPVRTYAVGFGQKLLNQLESTLGIALDGPQSVVYLDDPASKDNISVRAVKGDNGRPVPYIITEYLYDLFRPVVRKTLADLAQRLTGIKQIIALPFYLEDEVVGNLFVATRKSRFSNREIEVLTTFAQQAAVGVRNARLYRKAEERRQIAQIFGRMAFGAATNVHSLRNHIGAVRNYLSLIEMAANLSEAQQRDIIASVSNVIPTLDEAANILDSLHEPWRQTSDALTNVNERLIWALRKVFAGSSIDLQGKGQLEEEGLTIHYNLADNLPDIKTSPDMLTEAFRILVKNAIEAIESYPNSSRELWLKTQLISNTQVEITVSDSGVGIKAKDLNHIFEMGWSTKEGTGMGFGLFWTQDYIEGFGGSIEVESFWQEGTTFTVRLPIFSEQEDVDT